MAFVTVYSDHFRTHPIYPNPPFLPDKGWADLNGQWMREGGNNPEATWTDEEKKAFLRKAAKDFFWMSTYMADYNNNITPENRPWPIRKIRGKKMQCGKGVNAESKEDKEVKAKEEAAKLEAELLAAKKKSGKESELMRSMRLIFERDRHRLVKKPIKTARRINGYGCPHHYQCGITTYQQDICYPGYVYMRDNLVKAPDVVDGRQPFSETVFY